MIPKQISILQMPLYRLYYLEEITDEPLTKAELERFRIDYIPRVQRQIIKGLKWASEHPEYAFSSLLPEIKFSDQEAYRYLVNILRQIERHQS